jgi:hypothetical protein
MLECLKPLADCDPTCAEQVEETIYQNLADAADCSVKDWQEAKRRVKTDGWYGPISDEEYAEAEGIDMPMKRALQIIRDSMGAGFDDIEFISPDYPPVFYRAEDDDGNETDEEAPNCMISGDEIKREIFGWYNSIYG